MRENKLSFVNFADYKKEDLFAKAAVFHMRIHLEEKEKEKKAKKLFENFYKTILSVSFQISFVFFMICFTANSLLFNMTFKNAFISIPLGFFSAILLYSIPRYLNYRKEYKETVAFNKFYNGIREEFLTALETTLLEKASYGIVAHPEGLNVLEPEAKFRMIDSDLDIHHLIVKRKFEETDSGISFSLIVVRDPDFEDSITKNYSKIIFSAFSHKKKDEIIDLDPEQMVDTDSSHHEVTLKDFQEINRVKDDFTKLVEDLDIDVDSIMEEFEDESDFDYGEDDEDFNDEEFYDEDDFFGVDDEEFMELTPDQEEQVAEFMQMRFPDKMMELQRQADEIRRSESDQNYVKVSFTESEIEELKAFIESLKDGNN